MRGSRVWFAGVVVIAFAWPANLLAQPAPPPSAAAATAAAPAPVAATRTATVVFQADDADAVLESDWTPDGKASPWYAVCAAPCTEHVNADGRFRAAGPGLHPSTPFKLPGGRDRVVITGEMAGKSMAVPVALIVAGNGLFFVVGPIFLVSGIVSEAGHGSGGGLIATGAVMMLGGAVVGLTGVVMLIVKAQNKESKVQLARSGGPRFELPAGLALEARGVTF
jgi:hypothetical protein